MSNMRSHNLSENSEEPCTSFHHRYRPLSQLANREWPRNNMFPILSHIENSPLPDCYRLTVDHCHCQYWPFLSHSPLVTRQGDQGTTKVGKRISRALSKVSATGFTYPPSSVGVACSGKRCLSMPRPHWIKPVARTVKTTLDMRFPTFVVP